MSCHLDCWLMVELSFFSALAVETKLLTDDVVLQSPALVKLFKVLLAVGTKNQDIYKMAYWAMEIEEYEGGSPTARRSFGRCLDYMCHASFLNSSLRETCNLDLGGTHIGLAPSCTNPQHPVPPIIVRFAGPGMVDKVAGQWYSLPDEWNRTKDANQKWHMNTCHSHPHPCMADVLGQYWAARMEKQRSATSVT